MKSVKPEDAGNVPPAPERAAPWDEPTVTLPSSPEAWPDGPRGIPGSERGHSAAPRILVVDDNPAIHDDFRKILAPDSSRDRTILQAEHLLLGQKEDSGPRLCFRVDSAWQGEEALALVRQASEESDPYAAAFLDVRMAPGWDGVETAARIWKSYPDLQIILCTAHSDYSWEQIIKQLGYSDRWVILKKPFDNMEVLQLAAAMSEKWLLLQRFHERMEGLEKIIGVRSREQRLTQAELQKIQLKQAGSEKRIAAFCRLNERLAIAKTAAEAGEILVAVTGQLFGWDSCSMKLYSPEKDRIYHVFNKDTIDGERVDVPPVYHDAPPTPRAREIIEKGGQLILRDAPYVRAPLDVPFGDVSRPSASILYVAIREGTKAIGLLTVQSYSPKAYTLADLETLQSLADHCAGALNRIQAEEARAVLSRKMEMLLESTSDGLIGIDARGGCTMVNRAAALMLGGERDVLMRSPISEIAPLPPGPNVGPGNNPILDSLRTGQSCQVGDAMFRRRDGGLFPVAFSCEPILEKGVIAGAVITFSDITGRKVMEEQLRQSQKMDALGQLAGGVAHDFNNLVTVITGYSSMLLEDCGPDSTIAGSLREIQSAGDRAAKLTRQLLAFSRKQPVACTPLNVRETMADMTQMLSRLIGDNIMLQVRNLAEPLWVVGDAGLVELVVMNLVLNARDAMPSGGRITIAAETVSILDPAERQHPDARPGQFVCLSVEDTGSGMGPEVLGRIFEPFFTTKEQGKGTGLGLATAFGIVKQHNGWIEVQSQVNVGSRFQVFLPVAAQT